VFYIKKAQKRHKKGTKKARKRHDEGKRAVSHSILLQFQRRSLQSSLAIVSNNKTASLNDSRLFVKGLEACFILKRHKKGTMKVKEL
jgi:hypothetical protein